MFDPYNFKKKRRDFTIESASLWFVIVLVLAAAYLLLDIFRIL